jgi:hypothetical protein
MDKDDGHRSGAGPALPGVSSNRVIARIPMAVEIAESAKRTARKGPRRFLDQPIILNLRALGKNRKLSEAIIVIDRECGVPLLDFISRVTRIASSKKSVQADIRRRTARL